MGSLGRNVLSQATGVPLSIVAGNATDVTWRTGGFTIDWATVAAAGADVTLGDGTQIKAGQKYLRYGQVLVKAASGHAGPYDPAVPGRDVLARGDCGLVDRTVIKDGPLGLPTQDTDHLGVIDGGPVYIARVVQSGTAAHTLALGPTLAELLAAFPRLIPVRLAS